MISLARGLLLVASVTGVGSSMAFGRNAPPLSAPSLVTNAKVVCRVYDEGNRRVTQYCEDGYECDLAAQKCRPGPELRRQMEEKAEQERRELLAKAQKALKRDDRREEERRALRNQNGQYTHWNGDPRLIPSPRTAHRTALLSRPTTGYPTVRAGQPRTPSPSPNTQRLPTYAGVTTYLEKLIRQASTMQASDPNRAATVTAARKIVADHKLPIDVDQLLGEACGPVSVRAVDGVEPMALRWTRVAVEERARAAPACAGLGGDPLSDCQRQQYGLVVMEVEPAIKALCKAQEQDPNETNLEALGQCATRRFNNAWDARAQAERRHEATPQARACAPAGPTPPTVARPAVRGPSLRDQLRRALANMPDYLPAERNGTGDEASPTPSVPELAMRQPDPPTAQEADEAFCAFIARRVVRGQLTENSAVQIPAHCRSAVDAARSCTGQACSMADVVAESERGPETPMPWGEEDRQAVREIVEAGVGPKQ